MFIINCLELTNIQNLIKLLLKLNIVFLYSSKVQFSLALKTLVLKGSYFIFYTNTLDMFSRVEFSKISIIC